MAKPKTTTTTAAAPAASSSKNSQNPRRKIRLQVLYWLAGFISTVLFIILIVWLVLKPTKPKFYLQDAAVYSFNQSGGVEGNFLTTTLQATISSKNPNTRVGIHYDKLAAHAFYRSEPIAGEYGGAAVDSSYQGGGEELVWSPFLSGKEVPVSPGLWSAMAQDKSAGVILLQVKMEGRVRWRVGSWISGGYRIFVNCPALFGFTGEGYDLENGESSAAFKFRQPSTCVVNV